MNILSQIIPSDYCLNCSGCCRFKYQDSAWSPYKIRPVSYGDYYVCPHLSLSENRCSIYARRPFDCRLYPFILTCKNNQVVLGLSRSCPFISENGRIEGFKQYVLYLEKYLNSEEFRDFLINNPSMVLEYPVDEISDIVPLKFKKICGQIFNCLKLQDKNIFDAYLNKRPYRLSAYSFANIFIWSGFFDFFWQVLDGNFCLFAQDKTGCFMYLPALGNRVTADLIKRCFKVMDYINSDKNISRIENVEKDDILFHQSLGYKCVDKPKEYVYIRKTLAQLKGNKFKSKRSSCNYFVKNFTYDYSVFKEDMKKECYNLLRRWQTMRENKYTDNIYRGMLQDSLSVQRKALDNYSNLGFRGGIVKIKGRIKGYTMGFALNADTFCILFEIADLKFKGISQFIFREFARELSCYEYINVMDDSGLENLRSTKLSYKPDKEFTPYIVTRP